MREMGYAVDRKKQRLFYSTGLFCDVWKYVKLGRLNTAAPTLAKEPVAELLNINEVATGYLAIDTDSGIPNLVKCNLNFTDCTKIIKSNVLTVTEHNSTINGALWIRYK